MLKLKEFVSSREAIELLHRAGCAPSVIKHCKAVSKMAVGLATRLRQTGITVDVELVRIGSLLHDIGRAKIHNIHHAVIGTEILRSFGLPLPILDIVERHIGSGISADEAVKLGLPNKNFIPKTLEEKIVSYADKLIAGHREISFEDALKNFSQNRVPKEAINRFKKLHLDLMKKFGE